MNSFTFTIHQNEGKRDFTVELKEVIIENKLDKGSEFPKFEMSSSGNTPLKALTNLATKLELFYKSYSDKQYVDRLERIVKFFVVGEKNG